MACGKEWSKITVHIEEGKYQVDFMFSQTMRERLFVT
jgi:hypothetical protein